MARQRALGAKAALCGAGIPAADIALVETGGWTPEFGYAAFQEIHSRPFRPDAVFAGNDLLAIGAMRAMMMPVMIPVMGMGMSMGMRGIVRAGHSGSKTVGRTMLLR
jgi:DNA-binding LacI/PurR family transcriptional regulator